MFIFKVVFNTGKEFYCETELDRQKLYIEGAEYLKEVIRNVWPHFESDKFEKHRGSDLYKRARKEFTRVIYDWGARKKKVGPDTMTTHGLNRLRTLLHLEPMPIGQMTKVSEKFFEASIKLT